MKTLLLLTNMVTLLAVAYLYGHNPPPLFNQVTLDAVECPGISGIGASAFGVGVNTRSKTDKECNERASAQLMLAAGMPDNAKLQACQTESSLRNFATVDNCMGNRSYADILRDVQAKYAGCRANLGRPKWYRPIRKKRFKKCMGELA